LPLNTSWAADPEPPPTQQTLQIREVHLQGLERTDPTWLFSYLSLNCPCELSRAELDKRQRKLLTTQVFHKVSFQLTKLDDRHHDLTIIVSEKWTTIPVIRGAFGGGTPLLVAGMYDTHSFGHLWTFGGEFRKHGNAAPGGVIWARSPRWLNGNYYLNLELWKDRRLREIFDETYESVGKFRRESTIIRGDMLFPVQEHSEWQIGFHLENQDVHEANVIDLKSTLSRRVRNRLAGLDLDEPDLRASYTKTLLQLVYDNVNIDGLSYDGLRLILASGPTFHGNSSGNYHEVEAFHYRRIAHRWNFASHLFAASSSDTSFASQKFLGGFESIRGIPDGAIFGPTASYLNLELRHLTWRWPYLDVQNVAFLDWGTAGSDQSTLRQDWRASAGIGIRFSIPQVNRLVFRIDYAWSLDQYGASGITAGMNQFFQPYRPL
jgi:outer membrane protein assembly factor BamA